MFILDSLLIGSIRFVLDKVAAAAEAELNDDSVLREQLPKPVACLFPGVQLCIDVTEAHLHCARSPATGSGIRSSRTRGSRR